MAVFTTMPDEFGEQRQMYVKLVSAEVNNVSGAASYGVFRGFLNQESSSAGASHYFERMVKCKVDVNYSPWSQLYEAFMAEYGGVEV